MEPYRDKEESCQCLQNGFLCATIYLPKFYIDFENKDGRDAGKDSKMERDSKWQK
jgi:hypothetical protein